MAHLPTPEGSSGWETAASVGEVVGAAGTLLAFAVALALFNMTVRDRRRGHARLLSGWTDGAYQVVKGGARFPWDRYPHVTDLTAQRTAKLGFRTSNSGSPATEDRWHVPYSIVNNSDEMMSNVNVSLIAATGNKQMASHGVITSLAPRHRYDNVITFSETFQFKNSERWHKTFDPYKHGTPGSFRIRLVFQDTNGQLWLRITGQPLEKFKPYKRPSSLKRKIWYPVKRRLFKPYWKLRAEVKRRRSKPEPEPERKPMLVGKVYEAGDWSGHV